MGADYIKEPENGLIRFTPEIIEDIRKEYKFDNKEDREKAIAIMEDWIQQQDHFVKKDFSKAFIERSILTCKGSLERAKKQIDRMCTLKTLLPQFFQITNIKASAIIESTSKVDIAILPKLTDEYYRVIVVKLKPNAVITSTHEYTLFYIYLTILTEYLKENDFCHGYILIEDFYDTSASGVLSKVNLIEVQQWVSVLTEGYGCRIKAVLMVTASKFIENFIKLLKPFFSEKIGNRLHAVSKRELIKDLIHGDILPEDYGGPEKSIALLHDDLFETLSSPAVQELLKEMNKAVTDESKRRIDKFNDECMGMPGTFRTLSLD